MSESFSVGQVVWIKIRGYPNWPGIIKEVSDDNKEKKYKVTFFCDSSRALVPKKCLSKFKTDFELNTQNPKGRCKEAIIKASEFYISKNGEDEKMRKFIDSSKKKHAIKTIKDKKNDNEKGNSSNKKELSDDNKKENDEDYEGNNKNMENKEEKGLEFIRVRKPRKPENKYDNELINKISSFLRQMTGMINKKQNLSFFDENKEQVKKIFKFLSDYKMHDPIEFLRKTWIGKYVKYISQNIEDKELKELSNEVYLNLEEQLTEYLSGKRK